jgi:hypothetical protein
MISVEYRHTNFNSTYKFLVAKKSSAITRFRLSEPLAPLRGNQFEKHCLRRMEHNPKQPSANFSTSGGPPNRRPLCAVGSVGARRLPYTTVSKITSATRNPTQMLHCGTLRRVAWRKDNSSLSVESVATFVHCQTPVAQHQVAVIVILPLDLKWDVHL